MDGSQIQNDMPLDQCTEHHDPTLRPVTHFGGNCYCFGRKVGVADVWGHDSRGVKLRSLRYGSDQPRLTRKFPWGLTGSDS